MRSCRVCGCTDDNVPHLCVEVSTGDLELGEMACHWDEADLCSSCEALQSIRLTDDEIRALRDRVQNWDETAQDVEWIEKAQERLQGVVRAIVDLSPEAIKK